MASTARLLLPDVFKNKVPSYLFSSYYPLQPPSEDVNIDYTHFEQYSTMQVSPDVLILPSDLRFFVKVW